MTARMRSSDGPMSFSGARARICLLDLAHPLHRPRGCGPPRGLRRPGRPLMTTPRPFSSRTIHTLSGSPEPGPLAVGLGEPVPDVETRRLLVALEVGQRDARVLALERPFDDGAQQARTDPLPVVAGQDVELPQHEGVVLRAERRHADDVVPLDGHEGAPLADRVGDDVARPPFREAHRDVLRTRDGFVGREPRAVSDGQHSRQVVAHGTSDDDAVRGGAVGRSPQGAALGSGVVLTSASSSSCPRFAAIIA